MQAFAYLIHYCGVSPFSRQPCEKPMKSTVPSPSGAEPSRVCAKRELESSDTPRPGYLLARQLGLRAGLPCVLRTRSEASPSSVCVPISIATVTNKSGGNKNNHSTPRFSIPKVEGPARPPAIRCVLRLRTATRLAPSSDETSPYLSPVPVGPSPRDPIR